MSWGKYLSLMGLSTFKFMFAPLAGLTMKLSFLETYLSCVAGAILTALVSFVFSEFLIHRAAKRRRKKIKQALESGIELPHKKKFTFVNKMVVKIKRTFGIYGICLWAPLFLSIPGGTLVATKFYGKDKRAFPLIVFGILLNGFIITSIVYVKQLFS